MTEEFIRDMSDAIGRLQATFRKHGMFGPSGVVMGDIVDFHNLRSMPPPPHVLTAMAANPLPLNVACKVRGVAFLRPDQ
jgi:hypothetical protein